jgi:plastocyanin
MKKYTLFLPLIFVCSFMFHSTPTLAVKHVVTVGNFSFSPANLMVKVGDTIRWEWVAGVHTTTSIPGSIPAGAAAWDELIASSNTVFEYKVTEAGSYAYVCTPHAPDMAGTFIAEDQSVGVRDDLNATVQVYPNPAKGVFKVKTGAAVDRVLGISLYDISGKNIQNRVCIGEEIYSFDLSGHPGGFYFVRIQAGESTYTRRIMLAD